MREFIRRHGVVLEVAAMVALCLFLLVMSGCQSPTNTVVIKGNRHIVNSLWQVKSEGSIPHSAMGRTLSDSELQQDIGEYNATHTDDLLMLYYGDVPDISDAPTCDVFIVNPVTYEPNLSEYGVSRELLVENVEGWRIQAHGQLLFIDHVPPPPVVVPPASNFAYWALYVVDDAGPVLYEDHCGYRVDEQFYQSDIGDYASPAAYFAYRRQAFMSIVATTPGTHLVERQLYTAP